MSGCSLLLGDLELMSGPYSAEVGTSMGGWQSITTSTTSLFLDGSVVSAEKQFFRATTRARAVSAWQS